MSNFGFTIEFIRQIVVVGAVVVSTTGFVNAQSTVGEFSASTGNRVNQPAEFNALPFSAANRTNIVTKKPPLQLKSPSQAVSGQSNLRPLIGSQNQFGKTSDNRVSASPVSFQPPLTSQQSPGQQMAKYVDLDVCTVNFIDDILLPAKESGTIASLAVKEGDYIPAGTVVGKIDDTLYRHMLDQAKLRFELATETAEDTIAILAAEKKYKVAAIEAKKVSDLAMKGSKSDSDRLMAVYTKEIAAFEREKAVKEKQKAELEKRLEAARYMEVQTHIERHVLQSDFDAYVIKILKKPQEYVQQGEEVMRIGRMDRLWVIGNIDIANLNPDEVLNRPVTVTVARARGEETTFEGTITTVGLESQGGTRYMVKAEVQNRPIGKHWMLQPLSRVRMRIHLDRAPAPNSAFVPASSKR